MLNLIIFGLCLVGTHLLMLNVQNISSKGYYYGVFVGDYKLDEELKKSVHKNYTTKLNIAFIIIFAMLFMLNSMYLNLMSVFIYLAINLYLLKISYQKVKQSIPDLYTVKDNKDFEFDLELFESMKKLQKRVKRLFYVCFLITGFSLVYLILNYSKISDLVPVHWNIQGVADAFRHKNFIVVFRNIILEISLVVLFYLIGIQSLGTKILLKGNENRDLAIKYLRNISYSTLGMSLSYQILALSITFSIVNGKDIAPIILILSIVLIIFFAFFMSVYFYKLENIKVNSNEISQYDDEKWLYGLIYYNKEDSEVMVSKRFGVGYTLNFARIESKVYILITIVIFMTCFI